MSEPAPNNVLIAYASRYGATREIAAFIAGVLGRRGLETEVRPADEVTQIAPYRAVIVGSGVYFSGWLPEAVELLDSFQDELAEKPLWLFSDGPTDEPAPSMTWRVPEKLSSLLRVIAPQDVALFGGKVVGDELSLDDWLVNPGLRGADVDTRDWSVIGAWAEGVAETLQRPATGTPRQKQGTPPQSFSKLERRKP